MKQRQKQLLALAAALVVLAGAAIWYLSTYTWIASVQFRRSEVNVDLSGRALSDIADLKGLRSPGLLDLRGTGLTIAEYDQVASWYPGCRILWEVPFQGGFLENTAESVTVSTLTESDIAALSYLPGLKRVDAAACQDYPQLTALHTSRPELEITYQVPLGGRLYDPDIAALELADASGPELKEHLAWFPSLTSLHLSGALPEPEDIAALEQEYPQLDISWTLTLADQTLERDTRSLCLRGQKLSSADELERLLFYGPSLEKLELLESGLDNGALVQVRERHPGLELVWDVTIGERTFRTDVTELDLSEIPLTDVSQVEAMLPCFPELTLVDMSHCGLSSEELDAFNRRWEDVRILWTVPLGEYYEIRTDATFFMPYLTGFSYYDDDLTELKYCTDMVCIDLGHNPVSRCDFVATMPKLKYLIIADTGISSLEPLRGLEELVYLEMFLTKVTDYSPLLDCPGLLDLNLAYTRGDLSVLTGLTQLERLWFCPFGWSKNLYKTYEDRDMLAEALPNTQVVLSSESTGLGWRDHPRYREMRDILGMHYMY